MPDEPSGRGRRLFAGIGQPPFDVLAAPAAERRGYFSTSSNTNPTVPRRPSRPAQRRPYWSASFGGAVASQPSVITSRSAVAEAFRTWMSTAA